LVLPSLVVKKSLGMSKHALAEKRRVAVAALFDATFAAGPGQELAAALRNHPLFAAFFDSHASRQTSGNESPAVSPRAVASAPVSPRSAISPPVSPRSFVRTTSSPRKKSSPEEKEKDDAKPRGKSFLNSLRGPFRSHRPTPDVAPPTPSAPPAPSKVGGSPAGSAIASVRIEADVLTAVVAHLREHCMSLLVLQRLPALQASMPLACSA
jgi:hypothetical protein